MIAKMLFVCLWMPLVFCLIVVLVFKICCYLLTCDSLGLCECLLFWL